ncbi:MAG: S8 family serine peptidase [Alphaproteobacteria bacterium]
MSRPIRVGLLDSGVGLDAEAAGRVAATRSFTGETPLPDRRSHGTRLAMIILHHAPEAELVDAQVFGARMTASPEQVAAALDWLTVQSVDIVNLSFGLRQDRPVLRAAVERTLGAGVRVIAALPARGGPVYPGAYPGVVGVTGDARCVLGEISDLGGRPATFGASPATLEGKPGGASFATAHITGMLAKAMAETPDALAQLAARAAYHGPERIVRAKD